MEQAKTDSIFRKTTMEKVSSPERLSDYLRVTNPGVWAVLAVVLLLLAGLLVWASVGTLETTAEVRVIVHEQRARIIPLGAQTLEEGMTLRIDDQEYRIATVQTDSYGRAEGLTMISLPDGAYDGVVVVGQKRPISFLFESN